MRAKVLRCFWEAWLPGRRGASRKRGGFQEAAALALVVWAVISAAAGTPETAGAAANVRGGRVFFLSPRGDDSHRGTRVAPWRTFAHAWEVLRPGDTLLLLDGVYREGTTGVVQPNVRNGAPGAPIRVKALHDGAVTIDGEHTVIPLKLGDNYGAGGPYGDWYVVEGVIVRNGLDAVVHVKGSHNVLRRVSIYDGDPDDNTHNLLLWGNENLVEDVVVAGSGRYMINIYGGGEGGGRGNTVRRAFTLWRSWDGRRFCGVQWPNGNHIGIYNASGNTVENAIAYGRSLSGIFIQANSAEAVANDNQVLGSLALLQGRDDDGSVWTFGTGQLQPAGRPGPTADKYGGRSCDGAITQWEEGNQRTGFSLWGQGELRHNVFRDILAAGNVGLGLSIARPSGPGSVGTLVDHATIYDNGAYLADWEQAFGGQIFLDGSDVTVTNSRIANSQWANQGEGARLLYRYVDRQLTDQPLWPWPMENRIKDELGISVNELATRYANLDGFGLTVSPPALLLDRSETVEVTVKVDAFGKFAQPVTLHAAAGAGGLRIEPADATVPAPGLWKFKVTAPDQPGLHEVQITAAAEGASEVQRKLIVLVDPKRLFLPAVMAGKR